MKMKGNASDAKIVILLLLAGLFWLFQSLTAARAATIRVPGDQPNIQAAIDAETTVDGDVIELTATTYTGPGNFNITNQSKSLTIRSATGNPDDCIIDCEHKGFAFEIYGCRSFTFEGLTIKNAREEVRNAGGAIYFDTSGTPGLFTINDCIFENNQAGSGGAVMSDYTATVIYNNCKFIGNRATIDYADYAGGGAVYSEYHSQFTNCIFFNNSAAGKGGAVNLYAYPGTFTNCTFTLNRADLQGGAIWCDISRSRTSTIFLVSNSILWGDSAPEGNEIYEKGLPLIVIYSDIEGGHAGEGNIDADPQFYDAASGDLYLYPGSPCIDTGTFNRAPSEDIDGNPRPYIDGYDMGAYELICDFFIWSGTAGNTWDLAPNWNGDAVPGAENAVKIDGSGGTAPVIDSDDAECGYLEISDSSLTISSGGTLTINEPDCR